MKTKFDCKSVIRTAGNEQVNFQLSVDGSEEVKGLKQSMLNLRFTDPSLFGQFNPESQYFIETSLAPVVTPPPIQEPGTASVY